MRVLGAVLAGGQSRRFGSDKALAMLNGKPLIAHVIAAVSAQVDNVVVCGRDGGIADRPGPGLGPLGGLCAALRHAADNGFDAVLSVPCDTPDIPGDLVALLNAAALPACLADQPVIGLWHATLSGMLDVHLAETNDRSLRAWARQCGAVTVKGPVLVNVNQVEDMAALRS